MLRRTKIIATVGPASSSTEVLRRCILAGVNVFRINMSHGTKEEHSKVIRDIKVLASDLHKHVGILVDLQGPKIRIAKFKDGAIILQSGDNFVLDASCPEDEGDNEKVGIDYKDLPKDVFPRDSLLLDDGRIVLEVLDVIGERINTVVRLGGRLSNHKGINRLGGGLSAQALTPKDQEDILFLSKLNVDYVALSFPRDAKDMHHGRKLLQDAGANVGLIAKIERTEAVENLSEIIKASDAVMVARGDLGVEIGYAELPAVQKKIISRSRELDRAVITATQMMESMISNPIPTRAEVTDVANAVFQGTDAVMLSAETASGSYPVEVIENMAQVCLAAERQRETRVSQHRLENEFRRIDEAIAMATMYTANHLEVKAIVTLTETGMTPLLMSRIRSGIPIYGISRNSLALGRMTLYRGVYPIHFDITKYKRWQVVREVLTYLRDQGLVNVGERVIVTRGDVAGISGRSNSMKIVTVEPNI